MSNILSALVPMPAAANAVALDHFEARLTFQTDSWDTHDGLSKGTKDFIGPDVCCPDHYAQSRVHGGILLPHAKITERKMSDWPEDTHFVAYCAEQHRNSGKNAEVRLARLVRPVRGVIGGLVGWIEESFALANGDALSTATEVVGS